VTEELALQEAGRHGRTTQRDERPVADFAICVESARDNLFSRAGFTLNDDRNEAVGKVPDELIDEPHRGARPEHALERQLGGRPGGFVGWPRIRACARVMPETSGNGADERVGIERFREEVARSQAQRFNHDLHAALPRHQDDGHPGPGADNLPAQIQAVHLGHGDIGQYEIEILRRDSFQRAVRGRFRGGAIAFTLEHLAKHLARVGLVVHDENSWRRCPRSRARVASRALDSARLLWHGFPALAFAGKQSRG
jgi:hypothetical protein